MRRRRQQELQQQTLRSDSQDGESSSKRMRTASPTESANFQSESQRQREQPLRDLDAIAFGSSDIHTVPARSGRTKKTDMVPLSPVANKLVNQVLHTSHSQTLASGASTGMMDQHDELVLATLVKRLVRKMTRILVPSSAAKKTALQPAIELNARLEAHVENTRREVEKLEEELIKARHEWSEEEELSREVDRFKVKQKSE
ncbi:hypothetical protein DFQ28_008147 [Apophysomyces sp. BC1034]|nr:hypothetical protein DFQ28_008147 [Apophysomyces sp. BC1034]